MVGSPKETLWIRLRTYALEASIETYWIFVLWWLQHLNETQPFDSNYANIQRKVWQLIVCCSSFSFSLGKPEFYR